MTLKPRSSSSEDDIILYMDELPAGTKMNENSNRLLESDNTNNPRPTYGPEIDDLEPDEKPLDDGYDDNGIDDGLLPERHPNKPPGRFFPKFPTSPFPQDPEPDPGLEVRKKSE